MKSHVQLYAVTPAGPQPLPPPAGATKVHELFDHLPTGVYTALCTFDHNKFLRLKEHLERLERSMKLLGWSYRLDRRALRSALHQVCTAYPLPNSRVRVDVLVHAAAQLGAESRLRIGLSPWEPVPERLYVEGVTVGIARNLVRQEPAIKRAAFVQERRAYVRGVYESLLVDGSGRLLEGTTSNFYGVLGGTLRTAGSGVLEGIARGIVLAVARDLSLPVRLDAVTVADIPRLEEAALSSSSRGLIPVVQIENDRVADGLRGPLTRRLQEAYNAVVAREIREAIIE